MKVTKEQLKQIIREEIQQEGFLDSMTRFIKGTSKEYDAFIKKYEAARAKRKTMNLMQAAEDGNKQPFFDYIEMMTKLGEENLRFDPKDIGTDQKNIQKNIAGFIERTLQRAADSIAEIDQEAAKEAERKAEELRQKRKAEFANRPMVGVLTRAEKEAARKSRKASERKRNKKYDIQTRDAFSESKITKEDVKQIIREEIKNFKR